ncbi:PadR family transcriptional regulator [Schumannella soli]|uniref:Helix-turn-helix transcriptional regulator n=1 Tax=Schumannella soli TaxID=2590779 RepID=A0A506YBI8_9MICO|nr:PadR family transcriptional regulator [Schumannella soli]TPW77849.1 helix-turn-helix transcriptional regulator [Schumannella soli]
MAQLMQEPTFAILTSLAAGARHGYAIIADVAESSDGAIRLQPGTLYSALDRLTGEGRVEVVAEEIVSGRLRRSYALTTDGVAVLAAEAERRAASARRALARVHALPVAGRVTPAVS